MALLVACIACVNLLAFRREAARVRLDIWLVCAMLAVHITWVVLALSTGLAGGGDLLPLYTCDAAILAGVAWCIWKPRWLGHVLFYWAFLGGVVTLLLPDTFGYALPHFAVVYTLLFHILLLVLGLEVWAVEGVRPSWWSLVPVCPATAALIPLALVANATFGSDYMFVSRNPGGIFTFLDDFEGVARVGLTVLSAAGILVVGLCVWFVMDRLLQRWDATR